MAESWIKPHKRATGQVEIQWQFASAFLAWGWVISKTCRGGKVHKKTGACVFPRTEHSRQILAITRPQVRKIQNKVSPNFYEWSVYHLVRSTQKSTHCGFSWASYFPRGYYASYHDITYNFPMQLLFHENTIRVYIRFLFMKLSYILHSHGILSYTFLYNVFGNNSYIFVLRRYHVMYEYILLYTIDSGVCVQSQLIHVLDSYFFLFHEYIFI